MPLHLQFFLPLLFLASAASAQYGTGTQQLMGDKRGDIETGCRRVYLCISTGLNNPTGIAGAQLDIAINERVSAAFGAGRSSWGTKATIEGRYYAAAACNRGYALALGGSYNTGGLETTIAGVRTQTGTETVTFFQRPAFNANLSAYYFAALGRRGHRLHVQAGYSLPLHGGRLEQLNGAPLDPGYRRPLLIIPPGGPILAAGLSFGFGRF